MQLVCFILFFQQMLVLVDDEWASCWEACEKEVGSMIDMEAIK